MTNKIEEERTDAADTRARLADEVIKIKEDHEEVRNLAEMIKHDEKIPDMKNKFKNTFTEMNKKIEENEDKLKKDFDARLDDIVDTISVIRRNLAERDGPAARHSLLRASTRSST